MFKIFALLVLSTAVLTMIAGGGAADVKSPLDFKMKDINGKEVDLADYKGKVVLFVNVASKCGLTDSNYKGLEKLHEQYGKDGLVILGFPANEFGHQEPGSDAEISTFCTKNYGVKFPIFSKIVVKGDGIHPLYKYLTAEANPKLTGDISWNFEKFLVDRNGNVVQRFSPRTAPESKEVVAAIETEIAKK